MRYHSGLVSSFVFASTALAYSVEHSRPFARADHVSYDSFQAGIFNTFGVVTASLVAPPLAGDPGSGVNIFIAIDGKYCNNVSLRAGVKGEINDDEYSVYSAYYMWHPGEMKTFENVNVSTGDTITLTVRTEDPYAGSAHILNDNGGFSDVYLMPTIPLCRAEAVWMLEAPYDTHDYTFYPLANFISMTFRDAFAIGDGSQFIFPTDGPATRDIIVNNQAVTIVGFEDVSVTVSHL